MDGEDEQADVQASLPPGGKVGPVVLEGAGIVGISDENIDICNRDFPYHDSIETKMWIIICTAWKEFQNSVLITNENINSYNRDY